MFRRVLIAAFGVGCFFFGFFVRQATAEEKAAPSTQVSYSSYYSYYIDRVNTNDVLADAREDVVSSSDYYLVGSPRQYADHGLYLGYEDAIVAYQPQGSYLGQYQVDGYEKTGYPVSAYLSLSS